MSTEFKKDEGCDIKDYKINSSNGSATFLNYGATLHSLSVGGHDYVLGYKDLSSYRLSPSFYFGATVGRVCNRIANGKFTLEGKPYTLAVNNGPNHIHGGVCGFSFRQWSTAEYGDGRICMEYISPDMEEGYPGKVEVSARFLLTDNSFNGVDLTVEYSASTDKTTILNLCLHPYFRLVPQEKAAIALESTSLQVFSSQYVEKNKMGVPTGQILPVEGSAFDLRKPTLLTGKFLNSPEFANDIGLDIDYVMNTDDEEIVLNGCNVRRACRLECDGRFIEVFTDAPICHVYTGNYLKQPEHGQPTKPIKECFKYSAVAIECQSHTDAINHENFPSILLKPGDKYSRKIIYRFGSL